MQKMICSTIVLILIFIVAYFYFAFVGLENDFKIYAKNTNLLNLERDMQILRAVKDSNLTILKKDLDRSFFFHLKHIERDGITTTLPDNIQRFCRLYNAVSYTFEHNYKSKYPIFIKNIRSKCTQQAK